MSSASELDLMQLTDCDDGSSNDLTVSSHLEFRDGTKPLITKTGSGHMSPVRARTMKEYDQQIAELQKENFSLKLRIYFLEERMKNQSDGDAEDVFKQNIELKVEVESLKRDLIDKQELLKKASSALTSVTSHHQTELQQAKDAGIAEGQQMANSELEAVKLCIEKLRKELNAKTEEVENLMIQSQETEAKLSDLLTINRQLDSRWRQLEREKNSLEMQLEMLSGAEKVTTSQEENQETTHKDITDEVVRKDRLIEQLRCALKAKDVIIEQVEEEKKETIKETTMQFQQKIVALQAKAQQKAPEDVLVTVEPFKEAGRLRSAAGTVESEGSRTQKERKVVKKPVLLHAEVQTLSSEQTKDFEESLSAKEEQFSAVSISLSQRQMENERLKKQIGRRDREVVQLMDQLEKADESLKKQDDQLKELRSSLQEERHKNTDKMLELDVQYKALLDDGQQHLANQNETILRLSQSLKQKDEQLEKMLQLASLQDTSKTSTKIAEILRDMEKKNEEAVEELVAENSLNVKSKNEEISQLKKSLRQRTEDSERSRKELAACRQTIADMEAKVRLTDQTLNQMANTLRDQQMELQETEDHHGRDISSREQLIRQLMASLSNKDQLLKASRLPLTSDATVSVSSGSLEANDLVADLQNQLKIKEDHLQAAETRLCGLTLEMNCLRETLLKYRYSESSLVNPDPGKKQSRAKDQIPVMGTQDDDNVRTSKDSGNLSSSESEPLSLPEKLSSFVRRDGATKEIDRSERFQMLGMSTGSSAQPNNVFYEDKCMQTDKVLTAADEDEIVRLQAEIKRLKRLVSQTVAVDTGRKNMIGSQMDGRISASGAEESRNQSAKIASSADDADAGAMDVDGRNQSGKIASQEKHKIQARRHLTLLPAELSTSQDIQKDDPLLHEFSVAGRSPDPSSGFGRECRTTPPRSNISYLSVESSKRWSLEDAECPGLEGDSTVQMLNSFVYALTSFQALLPDDSTLSEMSNAELKDVICDLKQKVLNQRKALPQGTSIPHVLSPDASSHIRLGSQLQDISSYSKTEYDSTKIQQLERTLTEKEREISDMSLHLDELRTELSKSQETVQTFESESRSHRFKSQDSAKLVMERELNRLREELESSEKTVCVLKEQIELNTKVGKSSVGFNPELIVRMAKEIDKMKKELATKNEKTADVEPKRTDHADGRSISKSYQMTQKIDQATSTENLDAEKGQPDTASGKMQRDVSGKGVEDLTDDGKKESRRITMSSGKQSIDRVIAKRKSIDLDDSVEDENRILNTSSSGSSDGKMVPGQKKSQIPILKKSSRSQSLEGENTESESDRMKCLQSETKVLMLEAIIKSQAKQICDFQSQLKELGHQRSVEPQQQSGSATPVSLHAGARPPLSFRDQEVQRNGSSSTTDDHRLCGDAIAEKSQGAQSSEVTEGSLAYKLPSGDHDMSSDTLHQDSGVLSTPFHDTKAANDRAFVQLKNEVHVLKTQLEMYKRENSRLNDTIQVFQEQSLWLPGASPSVHNASSRSRGTSASAEEFLHHRMEVKKRENELQCNLDESHRNCDLLRTRLEELLLFMEELLPLIDINTPLRLASLKGKLNETRSLLADLSQSSTNIYDNSSLRMSQTGSYLSRLDLDASSTARIEEEDRSFRRSSHSMIPSVNSKDFTLSEGTSESELERQLQMEISSLDRINCELEQRLRQKELELASVVAEAASSRSQMFELLDEMNLLRTSVRGEEERTSVMKMELVDLKECNESLAKTLEEYRQKLEELRLERDDIDKSNHHLQVTLSERSAKVTNLEQELVDCEARRVKDLRQMEDDQLRRLAALEQERTSLMTKIELLSAEIRELKIEVVRERDRSAEAEVVVRDSCAEKLQDKDNIIQKLKELVKQNQMTAEDLGNQLHRLNSDVQEKKLTIVKLNKKCQDLQNSLRQSEVSSSLVRTGSLSEMASMPSSDQLYDIQGLKGSKVATQEISSTKELFKPPGGSTRGGQPVSGDRRTGLLTSKMAGSGEDHVDRHPDKDRILPPMQDYLDHKPTRDTSESSSSSHLSIIPPGIVIDDPIIFHGRKIPTSVSTLEPNDYECASGAGSLELQLIAAQETIRLLQTELKTYKQRKRLDDSKGEERIEEEEEETLVEAKEEIRQLRRQLEHSVEKNDQLRDLLMQQAKQTGRDGGLDSDHLNPSSNSRETLQSTWDLEMAQREVTVYKARISRLQSDLTQQVAQVETLQVEKNSIQRSLSATKLKLENAQAETRRLKEALDESNELNRTMRLELRLQEMMTKADNKENERGLSLSPSRCGSSGSPSRLELSDLMTEIRQIRIQMEKTIENNNVLRQKLDELSQNPLPSQSTATKISDSCRTKLSSASALLKTTETTSESSTVDSTYTSRGSKAAYLVPASGQNAVEAKKRDFIAGAGTDSSSTGQLVFAVADREVYERLKEEVSRNQVAIGKLEKSIQTIHSQVIEDDRKKDLSEVIQEMRTIANEQMQMIALFWFLNLLKPDKKATETTRVVENELLRKQLAALQQRYARAKHAMKGAQERLEANNRKKEEFFTMQKNKKEQAILEQISKTHQVLAQARQNLEAVHRQTSN